LGKNYPAIDVSTDDPDLLLALVDDFGPTAVAEDEHRGSVRVFFLTATARDAALRELSSRFGVSPIEVPDEDWARRSQENLAPVSVGRITILPRADSRPADPESIAIVVVPSMGFGTGHHATTRLCLAALQNTPLAGCVVLDVGTGSGVLALAARRLGAAHAVGIDSDPDAIESARDNLSLNPEVTQVEFEVADLSTSPLPPADVVTANLTGTLLIRSAPLLMAAVRRGGVLILSGILAQERDAVRDAFGPATLVDECHEDEWVALVLGRGFQFNREAVPPV
jgi:ribosomal protein L11 methyltransferase